MENPKALGFHQEMMKDPIKPKEKWKIQQTFQDWFCIKPYSFTRENYYKFRLQYKNSKSKTLSLMCLEILLSKHNT